MTDLDIHPALLPAGFEDVLPPAADIEARTIEALMDGFARHGYQRVKPPLLEFEETLLSGSGAAMAEQTFRLMDPESQLMMGLRADTTPQIARIAATRLAAAARPLRLSYAGQCLLVRGTQLAPERQMAQAGIELIGFDGPEADAEAILVAASALASVGIERISVDLTLPPLVPSLLEHAALSAPAAARLAIALDRKDAAGIAAEAGPLAALLLALLAAAGPADAGLDLLAATAMPAESRLLIDRLAATVHAIRARTPGLILTIDPIEFRGYRYHTGVSASLYAPGRQGELGRGGRYVSNEGEPATGMTLYPDIIQRIARRPILRRRLYLPAGSDPAWGERFRAEGYATIAGLAPVANAAAEARRLDCEAYVAGGSITPIGDQ
ncbi:MAG: ATP phosphoribosyltransferase regulatory subunit [Rhodospirillales bacterium 20-60-12]|nr:MAG: ATP phosphoribosyltransferase regulatory subunit [Rhodospirillales bacterium 20-60-12]HQT66632.1 ATP phosphoribosyltransferase regulatory subunit [Acetobacteraceae bacterium]